MPVLPFCFGANGLLDLKRPVVVMTPKSLLRLPEASSHIDQLVKGAFQTIIPDCIGKEKAKKPIFFLSGKVYYDVMKKLHTDQEAIEGKPYIVCRLEQLYPFPQEEVEDLFDQHEIDQAFWVQEEPENMGAWGFVEPLFRNVLDWPTGLHWATCFSQHRHRLL